MWRHIASNFLTLAVGLLLVIGGIVAWAKSQYVQPGPLAQAICLKVEKGSNFRKVADQLEARGAVSYPYIFRVGADYSGRTKGLKAGSYLVPAGASMEAIVVQVTGTGVSTCGAEINYRIRVTGTDVVISELDPATGEMAEKAKFDPVAGPVPDIYKQMLDSGDARVAVTVAEGATSWQIIDALSRAPLLTGAVKDVPAEGTLAPQQYEIAKNQTRADLVSEMLANQSAILKKAWDGRAEGLPYKTPDEALVMASLIEKETGVPAERAHVASVFLNRMAQGMKLQTDPAVIYGITKGQGVLGRGLRQSELKAKTPFNTYVIDGLPPSPIANPGAAAIEAAVHPDVTKDLFFVADGTGGHVFAETLDEHNRNVAKWRAIEAQQGGG